MIDRIIKKGDIKRIKFKLTNSNKVEDEKGYNYWHQINSQVFCLICQPIQVKCPANKKKRSMNIEHIEQKDHFSSFNAKPNM